MENTNSKRVTKDQKFMLIQYLEEHKEFAHDRFVNDNGLKSLMEQWNHLAEKLNACGGAIKDGEGWKRAWVNMRSKSKQRSQDLRNEMERSGVNSSIKHLGHLDERIIGIMTTVAVVGQEEVSEPLRSCGAVNSVVMFDTPEDHLEVEFIDEVIEVPTASQNFQKENTLPPQSRAPKRKSCSLEETNAKMLAIEERKLILEERKVAAMEKRNAIEERKVDALQQNNMVLKDILNKMSEFCSDKE